MRVLLVYPGHPGIRRGDEEEHLGLGYLAAVLRRDGHEVEVLDATLSRLGKRRLLGEIWDRRARFDLLGVSCLFADTLESTAGLITSLRGRGLDQHVTIGGHPPTFLYGQVLERWPGFDSVVVGEGEETVRQLVDAVDRGHDPAGVPGVATRVDGRGVLLSPRPMIEDLDSLPFPSRDTLSAHARTRDRVSASVLRSRGCYWQCSFCDTSAFYRTTPGRPWRSRDPVLVVDEIEELVRDHGVGHVRFWDDNFVGPGRRGKLLTRQLAEEMLSRGLSTSFSLECRVTDLDPDILLPLREAGLESIFLGIESGVQRSLDTFNKGVTVEENEAALKLLRDLDIGVKVGFILFDPYTTVDELLDNLDWLSTNVGSVSHIRKILTQPLNMLAVYEGAPIVDKLRQDGLLRGPATFYSYRFADRRVDLLVRTIKALQAVGFGVRDIGLTVHRMITGDAAAGQQPDC